MNNNNETMNTNMNTNMKWVIDLSNDAQARAGLKLSVIDFLRAEKASGLASGVGIAEYVENGNPLTEEVIQSVKEASERIASPRINPAEMESHIKNYLTLLFGVDTPEIKENRKKAYHDFVNYLKQYMSELSALRMVDKVVYRVVPRNVERLLGRPPGSCSQDDLNRVTMYYEEHNLKVEWEK